MKHPLIHNIDAIKANMETARGAMRAHGHCKSELLTAAQEVYKFLSRDLDRAIQAAVNAGVYCAAKGLSCDTPEAPLTVITEYGKFCCQKCADDLQQEIEGEAAVREEDMRDY